MSLSRWETIILKLFQAAKRPRLPLRNHPAVRPYVDFNALTAKLNDIAPQRNNFFRR